MRASQKAMERVLEGDNANMQDASSSDEEDVDVQQPSSKRIRFQNLSMRIASMHDDAEGIHALGDDRDVPEEPHETFFAEALAHWRELNTHAAFNEVHAACVPLTMTLPELVLHADAVFRILERKFVATSDDSLPAIIALAGAPLARDLAADYAPLYARFGVACGKLLLEENLAANPEMVASASSAMADAARRAGRYLGSASEALAPTRALRACRHAHVRDAFAAAAAPLLREKTRQPMQIAVTLVNEVKEIDDNDDASRGCGALLARACAGAAESLHSRATHLLACTMARGALECVDATETMLQEATRRVAEHVSAEKSSSLWTLLRDACRFCERVHRNDDDDDGGGDDDKDNDEDNAKRHFQNVDAASAPALLRLALSMMQELLAARRGAHVVDAGWRKLAIALDGAAAALASATKHDSTVAAATRAAFLSLTLCTRAPEEADVQHRVTRLARTILPWVDNDALMAACADAASAGIRAAAWASVLLDECLARVPTSADGPLLHALCSLSSASEGWDAPLASLVTKKELVPARESLRKLALLKTSRDGKDDDSLSACAWMALRILAAAENAANDPAANRSFFASSPPADHQSKPLLWSTWMQAHIASLSDVGAIVNAASLCLERGDAHSVSAAAAAFDVRVDALGIDVFADMDEDAGDFDVDGQELVPLSYASNFACVKSRLHPLLQARSREVRAAALRVLAGCSGDCGDSSATAAAATKASIRLVDSEGDAASRHSVITPARALVALLGVARVPESLQAHRRATTLISRHVTVFARGGGLRNNGDVRECVAGALLGNLHTQFTPLWAGLTEALGTVLDCETKKEATGGAVAWNLTFSALENAQRWVEQKVSLAKHTSDVQDKDGALAVRAYIAARDYSPLELDAKPRETRIVKKDARRRAPPRFNAAAAHREAQMRRTDAHIDVFAYHENLLKAIAHAPTALSAHGESLVTLCVRLISLGLQPWQDDAKSPPPQLLPLASRKEWRTAAAAWLSLFGSFGRWKSDGAGARTIALCSIALLAHDDVSVREGALRTLLQYGSGSGNNSTLISDDPMAPASVAAWLRPYREALLDMAAPGTCRRALTRWPLAQSLDGSAAAVSAAGATAASASGSPYIINAHRPFVLPVVIRLLFSYVRKRKGRLGGHGAAGKGKGDASSSRAARGTARQAVISYLAQCEPAELAPLLELFLEPLATVWKAETGLEAWRGGAWVGGDAATSKAGWFAAAPLTSLQVAAFDANAAAKLPHSLVDGFLRAFGDLMDLLASSMQPYVFFWSALVATILEAASGSDDSSPTETEADETIDDGGDDDGDDDDDDDEQRDHGKSGGRPTKTQLKWCPPNVRSDVRARALRLLAEAHARYCGDPRLLQVWQHALSQTRSDFVSLAAAPSSSAASDANEPASLKYVLSLVSDAGSCAKLFAPSHGKRSAGGDDVLTAAVRCAASGNIPAAHAGLSVLECLREHALQATSETETAIVRNAVVIPRLGACLEALRVRISVGIAQPMRSKGGGSGPRELVRILNLLESYLELCSSTPGKLYEHAPALVDGLVALARAAASGRGSARSVCSGTLNALTALLKRLRESASGTALAASMASKLDSLATLASRLEHDESRAAFAQVWSERATCMQSDSATHSSAMVKKLVAPELFVAENADDDGTNDDEQRKQARRHRRVDGSADAAAGEAASEALAELSEAEGAKWSSLAGSCDADVTTVAHAVGRWAFDPGDLGARALAQAALTSLAIAASSRGSSKKGNADDSHRLTACVATHVLPHVKRHLSHPIEAVRRESSGLLGAIVRALAGTPSIADCEPVKELVPLLGTGGGDEGGGDILAGLAHLQIVRRVRALRAMAKLARDGQLTRRTLTTVAVPSVMRPLLDAAERESRQSSRKARKDRGGMTDREEGANLAKASDREAPLVEASVQAMAAISASLPVDGHLALLRRLISWLRRFAFNAAAVVASAPGAGGSKHYKTAQLVGAGGGAGGAISHQRTLSRTVDACLHELRTKLKQSIEDGDGGGKLIADLARQDDFPPSSEDAEGDADDNTLDDEDATLGEGNSTGNASELARALLVLRAEVFPALLGVVRSGTKKRRSSAGGNIMAGAGGKAPVAKEASASYDTVCIPAGVACIRAALCFADVDVRESCIHSVMLKIADLLKARDINVRDGARQALCRCAEMFFESSGDEAFLSTVFDSLASVLKPETHGFTLTYTALQVARAGAEAATTAGVSPGCLDSSLERLLACVEVDAFGANNTSRRSPNFANSSAAGAKEVRKCDGGLALFELACTHVTFVTHAATTLAPLRTQLRQGAAAGGRRELQAAVEALLKRAAVGYTLNVTTTASLALPFLARVMGDNVDVLDAAQRRWRAAVEQGGVAAPDSVGAIDTVEEAARARGLDPTVGTSGAVGQALTGTQVRRAIEDAKKRGGTAFSGSSNAGNVDGGAEAAAGVLLGFALAFLHDLLKRGRYVVDINAAETAPAAFEAHAALPKLLVRCIGSSSVGGLSQEAEELAIKSLLMIGELRPREIVPETYHSAARTAARGALKSLKALPASSPLAREPLRLCAALLRAHRERAAQEELADEHAGKGVSEAVRSPWVANSTEMRFLMHYALGDPLDNEATRASAYALLKACADVPSVAREDARKMLLRCVDGVAQSAASASRTGCRAVLKRWLCDAEGALPRVGYPFAKNKVMARLLANLSQFRGVDGRAETLEVVCEIVSSGPPALLREAGLAMFASLAAAAALDAHAPCRVRAAKALSVLYLKRFDARKREQAMELLMAWMPGGEGSARAESHGDQDGEEDDEGKGEPTAAPLALATPTGSSGAVAACAALVVLGESMGKDEFALRVPTIAPAALHVLEESVAASVEGSAEGWRTAHAVLSLVELMAQSCAQSSDTTVSMPAALHACLRVSLSVRLLRHGHAWVRAASSRCLGAAMASGDAPDSAKELGTLARMMLDHLGIPGMVTGSYEQALRNLMAVVQKLLSAGNDEEEKEDEEEEEREEEEADGSGDHGKPSRSGVGWIFRGVSRIAAVALNSAGDEEVPGVSVADVIRFCAAALTTLPMDAIRVDAAWLALPLTRASDAGGEVAEVATAGLEHLRNSLGEVTYAALVTQASELGRLRKRDRVAKQASLAASDPAAAARVKLAQSQKRKEKRSSRKEREKRRRV